MQITAVVITSLLVAAASAGPTPIEKRETVGKWEYCYKSGWAAQLDCPAGWHCQLFYPAAAQPPSYGQCYPNPTTTPVHE
ncbi:hypothetical protein TWF481_000731 [Arthrobotrys musiformis]|uniref:CBM1 domain-containing protein n=1 Tax=Arthrobotrys musiformis TaxID=47236 RepID=A0AAV9WPZ4_9PEZI